MKYCLLLKWSLNIHPVDFLRNLFHYFHLSWRWVVHQLCVAMVKGDFQKTAQQFLFVFAYHELIGWPVEMPQYYVDQLPGIKQGLSNLFNMNIQFTCFSLSCVWALVRVAPSLAPSLLSCVSDPQPPFSGGLQDNRVRDLPWTTETLLLK